MGIAAGMMTNGILNNRPAKSKKAFSRTEARLKALYA